MTDFREAFRNAHKQADVDAERSSMHHTLGRQPNQAAPGDHTHAGDLGADLYVDLETTAVVSGNYVIPQNWFSKKNDSVWSASGNQAPFSYDSRWYTYKHRKDARFMVHLSGFWGTGQSIAGYRDLALMTSESTPPITPADYLIDDKHIDRRNAVDNSSHKNYSNISFMLDMYQGLSIAPVIHHNAGVSLDLVYGSMRMYFMGFVKFNVS